MAQYKITVDSKVLHQLFLGNAQDEGRQVLLESVLNQSLDAQASEQLGAERYERTDDVKDTVTGYYSRKMTTRVGGMTLYVPRLRNGKFSTDMLGVSSLK